MKALITTTALVSTLAAASFAESGLDVYNDIATPYAEIYSTGPNGDYATVWVSAGEGLVGGSIVAIDADEVDLYGRVQINGVNVNTELTNLETYIDAVNANRISADSDHVSRIAALELEVGIGYSGAESRLTALETTTTHQATDIGYVTRTATENADSIDTIESQLDTIENTALVAHTLAANVGTTVTDNSGRIDVLEDTDFAISQALVAVSDEAVRANTRLDSEITHRNTAIEAVTARIRTLEAAPAAQDGVDGRNGRDGINGVDGINGIDGQDGAQGIQGERGERGLQGEAGTNGQDGEDAQIFVSSNSATVTVGSTTVNVVGVQGETGAAGRDGIDGITTVVHTVDEALTEDVVTAAENAADEAINEVVDTFNTAIDNVNTTVETVNSRIDAINQVVRTDEEGRTHLGENSFITSEEVNSEGEEVQVITAENADGETIAIEYKGSEVVNEERLQRELAAVNSTGVSSAVLLGQAVQAEAIIQNNQAIQANKAAISANSAGIAASGALASGLATLNGDAGIFAGLGSFNGYNALSVGGAFELTDGVSFNFGVSSDLNNFNPLVTSGIGWKF